MKPLLWNHIVLDLSVLQSVRVEFFAHVIGEGAPRGPRGERTRKLQEHVVQPAQPSTMGAETEGFAVHFA